MSLDKYVAERRRFARLLGTDDEVGSGLPIGPALDEDDDGPGAVPDEDDGRTDDS